MATDYERRLPCFKKSYLKIGFLLICGMLARQTVCIGQDARITTASLKGVVRDLTGAAVPDAKITITNKLSGATQTVVTNASGEYAIANLPVGTYDISVEANGFAKMAQANVRLLTSEATSENFALQVAAVSSTVSVSRTPNTRITARQLLLPDEHEAKGFGLYSYLLFGSPPTEATRQRYLEAINAYLGIPSVQDFEAKVPMKQLNVTYLPAKQQPPEINQDSILGVYDYAGAQIFLAKLQGGPYVQGPYIASCSGPLTQKQKLLEQYLFQDMSSVPPEIIVLWVKEFMQQSSQQDFWRKRKGPQVALGLRTAISTVAAAWDPAQKAAGDWQNVLATLLSWKGK